MNDECSTFIYPEYTTEYQELHKAICINLNKMIWNIAFLKKAKEARDKGVDCRNDFAIDHLYKNEFELLVLRYHRTFLDKGQDVITLSRLKDNLFSKYLMPEHKKDLSKSLKNIAWDSSEIITAKRRLSDAVPIFRHNYIAHTLMGEISEVLVSYQDCEKIIIAACDLFNRLSYATDSFYLGTEKHNLKFMEEKVSSENFFEEFFLFQQTSAWSIKKLDCDCSSKIVAESIDKINFLLSENSIIEFED